MKKQRSIWAITVALIVASLGCVALIIYIALGMGSRPDESSKIKIEQRQLHVFELDSLIRSNPYELAIEDRDSVVIYRYKNLKDSVWNMDCRYDRLEKRIYYGPYHINMETEKVFKSTYEFDLYDESGDYIHGIGPLLFNEKYGALGWDNGDGVLFFFSDSTTVEQIPIDLYQFY